MFKHNIGDQVYYLSQWRDGICYGTIAAMHYDNSSVESFVNVTIHNPWLDDDEEKHEIISYQEIFDGLEECYQFLRDESYYWHNHDEIKNMDKGEFNKMFDAMYKAKNDSTSEW